MWECLKVSTSSLMHSFCINLHLIPRSLDTEGTQVGTKKCLRRFSMVRYFILRRKPPPANSETASWFRPRRGWTKHVKRAKLVRENCSASKPSIRKIMAFRISKKNPQYYDGVERAYINQPDEPLFPVYPLAMRLGAIKDRTIN